LLTVALLSFNRITKETNTYGLKANLIKGSLQLATGKIKLKQKKNKYFEYFILRIFFFSFKQKCFEVTLGLGGKQGITQLTLQQQE
jgi:hypothetical protein